MRRLRHHQPLLLRNRNRRPFAPLGLEVLEERNLLTSDPLSGLATFDHLTVDRGAYDPHRILVRFRETVGATVQLPLPTGTTLGAQFELIPGLREVQLDPGVTVEAALKAYAANPTVVEVRPDYRVQALVVPNDPQFSSQWGLHNTGQTGGTVDADIDAPEAWDVTTGTNEVIVAVIDTGVDYTHPDLAPNMWTNTREIPGNGFDDDLNGYRDDIHGYDFANNDSDPMDDFGHGTHVAGIIGAKGNNSQGIAGVAWNVKIMALKFLDGEGGGFLSDALQALYYAVSMGARVSNNSWGGGPPDDLLREAIRNSASSGHVFVTAAGNNSSNNDLQPNYPGSYRLPNVLSVAATDANDRLASFSNYGPTTVHLAAPGVNILSTASREGSLGSASGYSTLSGTSMAAPFVSGVVALVRGQHPTWSTQQVISQVLATVDSISSLENLTITGGRLNAAGAVGNAVPDTTGPHVLVSTPTGSTSDPVSKIRLTFSEAIAAGSFTTADLVSLRGPSGAVDLASATVSEVAGSNGLSFDVTFAEQSAQGDYELVVGPQILDRASPGNLMDQDRDGNKGEATEDRYTARFQIVNRLIFTSDDVPLLIPDLGTIASVLYIDQAVQIGDLDVKVNLTHTSVGDLALSLVSPSNTTIALSQFRGGFGGQDYQDTRFDDEAGTPIGTGQAPFSGSYQPETSLAAVDRELTIGYWYLVIEDIADLHGGILNAWSLEIAPDSTGDGGGDEGNRPPNADDDFGTTDEDTPLTVAVLANDQDPDGDTLQVTLLASFDGEAIVNADQTVTFLPRPNYHGLAGFTYEINDGQGGVDQASVYLNVTPVNDAPIARDDFAVAIADTPLVFETGTGLGINLVGNDEDPDRDELTYVSVSNAVNGTVTVDGPTRITFVPDRGFSGLAEFDYTITDGELTSTARVYVSVRSVFYVSTSASRTLLSSDGTSVAITRSDIVKVSVEGTGTSLRVFYEMYFQGSAVGLTTVQEDVDAFTFLPDGSILVSTTSSFNVPGPRGSAITGAGEDLLRFVPTTLGTTTTGRWEIYFDGSDVGLSGSTENVDSVAVLSDGRLLLSTAGNVSVPGAAGADTDLLVFTPRALGSSTSGTWAVYFDGSDVGLSDNSNEDIDGLHVAMPTATNAMPTLYLTPRGGFAVPGVSGSGEDVVAFKPVRLGATTTGSYGPGLAIKGSSMGFRSLNVDGIWIGPAPRSVSAPPPPPPSGAQTSSLDNRHFDVDALNLLFSEFSRPASRPSLWASARRTTGSFPSEGAVQATGAPTSAGGLSLLATQPGSSGRGSFQSTGAFQDLARDFLDAMTASEEGQGIA